MDEQDKPKSGKKGKLGQAEGRRSKVGVTDKVPDTPKKPGRQKQTGPARAEAAKRARSVTVPAR